MTHFHNDALSSSQDIWRVLQQREFAAFNVSSHESDRQCISSMDRRHMEMFRSIVEVPHEKSSGLFRGIRLESNRKIPRKRRLVTLSVMLALKPIEEKKG